MYQKKGSVVVPHSVSLLPKNLQVVSFDPEWREIYLGTLRRDGFAAVCPHDVPTAAKVDVQYSRGGAAGKAGASGGGAEAESAAVVAVTAAKWCPLDNCTILVLCSQTGIKMFDWDGTTEIFEYDFHDNGIGVDERLVAGGMARGIAAVGPSFIAVGVHTGTVVVFEVTSGTEGFGCRVADSQRSHCQPITDLASTNIPASSPGSQAKDFLASADETGLMNVWSLGASRSDGIAHKAKIDSFAGTAVTVLALWNKIGQGMLIAGYGSGLLRFFSLPTGYILAEVSAHAGWLTGMDLASQSGLLITCADDGFVRLWQLSSKGKLVQHAFSYPISNSLLTGVKFLDPKGVRFALASYDSNKIQCYSS